MDLMIFASGAESVVVPRALRRNLFERLIMPCCLPAWAATTRPFDVTLNRFLQLDFVFILGISVSYNLNGSNALRHANWPKASVQGCRIWAVWFEDKMILALLP